MVDVDLTKTIVIPTSSARTLFVASTGGSNPNSKLELVIPTAEELADRLPLERLETPWDLPWDHYRIARFNHGPLRMVTRRQGNVDWSRVIEKKHRLDVYRSFLDAVRSAVYRWEALALYPPGESVRYDLDICERLLSETFLNSEPPRLIPRFEWPARESCIDIVRSHIDPLPWKFQDYFGSFEGRRDGERYRFEARGERGELEGGCVEANPDDFYFYIFNFVARRAYLEKDANFTANGFYILDDAL